MKNLTRRATNNLERHIPYMNDRGKYPPQSFHFRCRYSELRHMHGFLVSISPFKSNCRYLQQHGTRVHKHILRWDLVANTILYKYDAECGHLDIPQMTEASKSIQLQSNCAGRANLCQGGDPLERHRMNEKFRPLASD